MERLSYKCGCGIHKHMHIEMFKRRAGFAIGKWLWLIINMMLFKTVIPLRI